MVADITSLVVQEWPSEVLSQADPDSEQEFEALRVLISSVKRQAELLYGQKRFASLWIAVLQILIPIIVQIVLEWWRKRKTHRSRVIQWRRKWKVDD